MPLSRVSFGHLRGRQNAQVQVTVPSHPSPITGDKADVATHHLPSRMSPVCEKAKWVPVPTLPKVPKVPVDRRHRGSVHGHLRHLRQLAAGGPLGAMGQRILSSHIPPCNRHMINHCYIARSGGGGGGGVRPTTRGVGPLMPP